MLILSACSLGLVSESLSEEMDASSAGFVASVSRTGSEGLARLKWNVYEGSVYHRI